ncbi:MAG: bifunctional folylpolyglutamate synthase/dihydrofolate synthase [Flavobacteriales bacterium]|nr:bifunctional folylpolyglutamate synthase/dihydrofolate synthase [Flavobacteriales bacterium]MCC6938784.1 bifunctional folylpolyglutamate synthase/dihydrofolate synthase [Flavobacteriales bacterium]
MTYPETLAYLYAQLPMFQRIGAAAYKADLSNTHALMDLLGHPEKGLRCVHVAGTNGKGSTCHLLASILQEAGYKVGLHTSPHLKDFRERCRINGEMIPEGDVVLFVEEYRAGFEPIQASFFEWTVALAFWWFREEQVDIAIVETGMGGRLDSTNVVTPEVSVITNIGWDHTQFLGHTLEAIAAEKAGIIKPGVPVVIGRADGAVRDVFLRTAATNASPIHFTDQHAPLQFATPLTGAHQEENARTVLSALDLLRNTGWQISDLAIEAGFANVLQNTGIRGRWQTLAQRPFTICDVAHNVDGIRVVNELLGHYVFDRLHIVLGMVNDKDLSSVLKELPRSATYYFCKADIPRGLDVDRLRSAASEAGLGGNSYPSVRVALETAQAAAERSDLILITGSVFVVAEVL